MAVHEVTLMVTTEEDRLTPLQLQIMGRDAAEGLLNRSGIRGMERIPEAPMAISVRHLTNEWQSRRYIGAGESEEWAITPDELEGWADDDDEW